MKEYWTSESEQIIHLYMLLDSWAMCLQWESGILANTCMGWVGCINFIGPLLAPYIIVTRTCLATPNSQSKCNTQNFPKGELAIRSFTCINPIFYSFNAPLYLYTVWDALFSMLIK
jgi:hypothetical protein